MPNTILTHQMIARESAAMLMDQVPMLSNINRARESEFQNPVNGYRKGDTVSIKIPPDSKVFDGATFAGGGAAPAQAERFVNLTIDTQKHVPLEFTSVERALKLEDFRERFLKPAINSLAAVVHADILQRSIAATPNLLGTAGSLPTSLKTFAQARARISQHLAPDSSRNAIISYDVNTEMVDSSKALFNPTREVANQYTEGSLGRAQGMEFFETSSLPNMLNGSKVTGVTVSGAAQSGSNLVIGGLAAGDTFKKGQVFTIAGVFATHPLTGITYPFLRQFVITADVTSAGTTATLPIFPAINATAPGTTVSALPANAAALTFTGAANTAYRNNLVYQRDAFTLAMVPLKTIAGSEGYTFTANGMSVRVMTFGNGNLDLEDTRIDVLYGMAAVRSLHACRVTE